MPCAMLGFRISANGTKEGYSKIGLFPLGKGIFSSLYCALRAKTKSISTFSLSSVIASHLSSTFFGLPLFLWNANFL